MTLKLAPPEDDNVPETGTFGATDDDRGAWAGGIVSDMAPEPRVGLTLAAPTE